MKRLGAIAAAAVLCFTLVTPAVAASDITVGDFVQRLAKAKGLAGTDARVANDALRWIGIRLPDDLKFASRLTEGDVAVISRAAGLNVHTSNPTGAFGSQQADVFFFSFDNDLGADELGVRSTNPGQGDGPGNGNGGPPFDPFTKGKAGKGKGKGVFTPTEPQ
jgi:hypothetical protein